MDRKLAIESKLFRLGATTGKSCHDTMAAVLLAAEDQDRLNHAMRLYDAAAKVRGTSPQNVMRNIHYLINYCWEQNREGVIELMGYETATPPTPTSFISALAGRLLREELAENERDM